MNTLIQLQKEFSEECSKLSFSFDGYVYNPLEYAWKNYEEYLSLYVKQGAETLFLGMNPGPFGMLQTGIPFGEINAVKNYLKINNIVLKPKNEHPQRPVLGMQIKRSEISGLRFWSLIEKRFPTSEMFVNELCVLNFCPLCFISKERTAKNITLDKLVRDERVKLENLCLKYLKETILFIKPQFLIGVGQYAEQKLIKANEELGEKAKVFSIIHPSPGNPQANRNWLDKTINTLRMEGVWY